MMPAMAVPRNARPRLEMIAKQIAPTPQMIATGNAKQFVMPNTDKTAVEIEWELETPVREDIYQYIVNE